MKRSERHTDIRGSGTALRAAGEAALAPLVDQDMIDKLMSRCFSLVTSAVTNLEERVADGTNVKLDTLVPIFKILVSLERDFRAPKAVDPKELATQDIVDQLKQRLGTQLDKRDLNDDGTPKDV